MHLQAQEGKHMANDSSVNLKPLKTFKLLGETVEMVVTGAMTGKHSSRVIETSLQAEVRHLTFIARG
jgi:hypothetical protein